MKILTIIPARYQSSRFPGKPLVDIKGKSLLKRTWEQVQKNKSLTSSIIATDDERIYNHAESFGARVIMTSPSCPTGTDRLAEVVEKLPDCTTYDVIVNVQGDEPCIDPAIITHVAQLLMDNPSAVIGTAVTELTSEEDYANPNITKCVKALNGKALYFSRSQLPGSKSKRLTMPAFRHLGIYAFRPHFLPVFAKLPPTPLMLHEDLEMLKAMEHGYDIYAVEVLPQAPGIDTPEDILKLSNWIS